MKSNTEPIIPGLYYHIYNRGINGENLFFEARNYRYFLEKYAHHVSPVADTYAYCLLRNHFHLLVRIKPAAAILQTLPHLAKYSATEIVSRRFGDLFNGYAQAINKAQKRTGGLFETPFRRIPVLTQAYFRQLVHYIHCNPQRHGFIADYRHYPHSSYASYLSAKASRLRRDEAYGWFDGRDSFLSFHKDAPLTGPPDFEREMVIEY